MTTIPLPFDAPPMTKNKVRRMHYHAEANLRRNTVDAARYAIRAARPEPMVGANITLHWRVATRRRQDGDGAQPTLSAAIDALVLEGVLPDDSWVHVVHSGVTCHPPSDEGPALWLEITPVEDS